MSVDNTNDKLVLTKEPIDTAKKYSQPDTATSYSSIYSPRNASASSLSPSATLPAALTSYSKSHNRIE